ncbi:MAG TPA: NADP-dependent malic enzyme [Kofleriaceae bacterium]|nr:NADP-dependent malic enzyme [Kofleriaceae bacterium]
MARKNEALSYHVRGRAGKIEVVPTKPLLTQRDLSLAYSPGVAEPCLVIADRPERGWEYTARGNLVAVITNGTAVLGLGDIGPLASKPVMEGKACLFKKFADIDAFDLELDEKDVDKIVDIVAALEPTFGGVNLEDFAAPACFEVEEKLRKRLSIPVFHDDQHGTAIISGAALVNAAELAEKKLSDLRIVVSGAGASAIACAELFIKLGCERQHITLVDSKGVVREERDDLNRHKRRFARPDTGARTLADALKNADVLLGLSVGNIVSQDMVKAMAERPIIFALANPDPEISYPDALAARPDAIVATGRSDFPNQVNNVLGFPYVFRGALDVRAKEISEPMKIAASRALAALAHEPVPPPVIAAYGGKSLRFGPSYLIPKPFDARVLWWVAPAVAKAAMDSGVARVEIDTAEYTERLRRRLGSASYAITRGIMRAAKQELRRIVFPEASNPKLLQAVQTIVEDGIAHPILLGRRREIESACRAAELDLLDMDIDIIDPREAPALPAYTREFYECRQRKGVTLGNAKSFMVQSNYFGTMMLKNGDADGLVSGFRLTYPETIRPALQIFGLRPGVKVATGMYMMVLRDTVKFFADATINIEPDAETLADIAIQVADAVRALGITPRVAMISFSNFGSVKHPQSIKVKQALELVVARRPDLEIDGEMQADFALDRDKMEAVYPFSRLSDAANVLVFPSLAAGNAAYKILQTIGGARAVGPILLGLDKPVAVLQPQASVEEIVDMTAYTAMVAQSRHHAAARPKIKAEQGQG